MKQNKIIQELEAGLLRKDHPSFRVGDTLCVQSEIVEGGKKRVQAFTGTVVARDGGGLSETVTLYRVSHGAGVEKLFLLHSPRVVNIEVVRSGKVRRSKLYHLRGAFGKAAKVKELVGSIQETAIHGSPAPTPSNPA